jgi:hypothetical protein
MQYYQKGFLFILVLFGLMVFNDTNVMAACTNTTCTGSIQRLYVNDAGMLYISTDGNELNLDCVPPADIYITLPPTDPNFDRKYAMLLTAMSLDQVVVLRINNGSDGCTLNYITWDYIPN